MNLKFRRQHPLANYILDFYCHEKLLCVELDGSIHDDVAQSEYDSARTDLLNRFGITVMRFKNDDVLHQLKSVLKILKQQILLIS